jgi:hypothetical protein
LFETPPYLSKKKMETPQNFNFFCYYNPRPPRRNLLYLQKDIYVPLTHQLRKNCRNQQENTPPCLNSHCPIEKCMAKIKKYWIISVKRNFQDRQVLRDGIGLCLKHHQSIFDHEKWFWNYKRPPQRENFN